MDHSLPKRKGAVGGPEPSGRSGRITLQAARLLESVAGPKDVRNLAPERLPQLAWEIRAFLVERVCTAGGGHLGPNLGVVELTLALHRAFDSPWDALVFDTEHQAYVHKLPTRRRKGFARLRPRACCPARGTGPWWRSSGGRRVHRGMCRGSCVRPGGGFPWTSWRARTATTVPVSQRAPSTPWWD
ncbi:1-deoxy-D-xylulose-5-phosphate synthase N-terminal domain-containing protein [Streptomyces sp. NPDC059003]|uniref:1-deoxy-D-xylulose-5-phosphate synthase N-terminal domain-containing protein n=1 Tax=Streptomyces sp. NPDC059003 TaxID=3346691 RepID=UPI0036B74100